MAVQPNYPAATPSLLLDFANNKRLDPRITFTRTTTATYYDGSTTAKAEENLLLYSQEFDNASYWDKISASVSANAVVAPDGTSTAETITFTGAGSNARIVAVNSVISGATYTYSVFLKGTAGETVSIEFDTTPGTTVTLTSTWARYSVTNAATAGTVNSRIISRTGNTATVFDAWGAQLEQRSSVTAYTATTTQPITNYIPVLQTAVAGQARFDHNPTTDESLGLLVEEARTNLFLRSEEFDNAYWTKSGATITANNVVAPNGTLTADTFTVPSSPGYGSVYISIALTATQYTMSVFAKGSATVFMYLATSGFGTGGWGEYNLSTGAVTRITNFGATTGSTASMTPVGNGWYRCSLTVLCTATTYVPIIGTYVPSAVIWGAQLEAGAFATSYIATTSATVTRNADVASITGNNFTSWYNQGEGAFYAEGSTLAAVLSQTFFAADDGTENNFIALRTSPSSTTFDRFHVTSGGVTQAAIGGSGYTATSTNKFAFAYKTDDFARSRNGGTVGTDAAGTVPVVNQMFIGSARSSLLLNGTIKKLAYYPVRITNANLQALTS